MPTLSTHHIASSFSSFNLELMVYLSTLETLGHGRCLLGGSQALEAYRS
jgi:hypothetical protein